MADILQAIETEDLQFFKRLHNNNFDFTQSASKPLREAARRGKTAVVALIAPWSDPQVQHNEPLVLAAQHGHTSTVQALIPYSSGVLRALTRAATHGHNECIAVLLDHISLKNNELTAAVDHLLSAQCLDAVEYLIPNIDVDLMYSQLTGHNALVFDQVRAAREKKLMSAHISEVAFERKISKI